MSAERIWANSTVAGLLLLAALLIFYACFSLRSSPRLAAAGLALALSVLLHPSQLLFFGAAAGLALGFLIVVFDRAVLPWLTAALVAPVLVNLPWLLASDLGGKSRLLLSLNSVVQFGGNVARYASKIELYAFPALLLAAGLVLVAVAAGTRMALGAAETRAGLFLVAFVF